MLRPASIAAASRWLASMLAAAQVAAAAPGAVPSAVPEAIDAGAVAPLTEAAPVMPLRDWQDPPREARPMARWWWPGGSVDPDGLEAELRRIARAGFGGVELQPLLLGLGADDVAADPSLRIVGLPVFHQRVARAAAAAERAGLDFDVTLGSGWPGGLPTSTARAERQLLMASMDLSGPSHFQGALPEAPDQSYRRAVEWILDVLGPADPEVDRVAVLAGRVGPARDGVPSLRDVRDLTDRVRDGRLDWTVPEGDWRVFAFYTNSTSHFVMGGAFPGAESDALVVDHLSQAGADALLHGFAEPLLRAMAPRRPRAIFVDSFELMGELPFSADFLEAFETRTGYDLGPHLPLVFRRGGESKYGEMIDVCGRAGGPAYVSDEPGRAERIREDYEAVRRALFEERFVGRLAQWARSHGVALRLQAHGGYGDYLDTYGRADTPEAEGLFAHGSFDFLKLAASAAHVTGRRIASSESFITLRLFGTALSRDDMRLLAGRAFSAGINRLVYHGVPHPYTRADGEAWYPFSGGFGRVLAGPLPMSLRIDADVLDGLADFNRFVARLGVAMSHGDPAADVAWLRADPAYPDSASLEIGRVEPHAGESSTTGALRGRGLVHDRVSRRMLSEARPVAGGARIGSRIYRAVLLDPLEAAEPELVSRVADLAEAGVPVVALGALPQRAVGLRDAFARDRRVRRAVARLARHVHRAQDVDALSTILEEHVRGELVEPPAGERIAVSLERRRGDAGHILLVFNESWSPTTTRLRFTRGGGRLMRWDPWTGTRTEIREAVQPGDVVALDLGAAEVTILTSSDAPRPKPHGP